MSLCKSIASLSMAYLDDELAAEERHELEAHLTECASCRAHLASERSDQSVIRRALAAPPAPDMLRARLARALDEEERVESKATRRRWSRYLLPGSAMVAAAAAMVVFLGAHAPTTRSTTVVHQAARQGTRPLPFEVQGASTGPWLRQNFASFEPPQIEQPNTQVLGARLLPGGIDGHDAVRISYRVPVDGRAVELIVLAVRDLAPAETSSGDWTMGRPVRVNNRTMRVIDFDGGVAVSYVDRSMGYVFLAPELTPNELVWLISRTDLVGP